MDNRISSFSRISQRSNDGAKDDGVFGGRRCGQESSKREQHYQMLKLTVLAVLPGLILVVRNTCSLLENVKILRENSYVKDTVKISTEIGEVIHAIQKERGTTALYVSSGGDPYIKSRLLALYQKTDHSISKLSKWIPIEEPDYCQSRATFQHNIHDMRSVIDPLNITLNQTITFYTEKISALIRLISKSLSIDEGLSYWKDLVAYQMLIASMEQAGIERALGSIYFARGKFSHDNLVWYKEKQVLGLSYLDQCCQYSTTTCHLLDVMFLNTVFIHQLNALRENVAKNIERVPSVLYSSMWFDNMTEYIDILKSIQIKLTLHIIETTIKENNALVEKLILNAVELVLVTVLAPTIVLCVRNIVRKMQAFAADLEVKTIELVQAKGRTESLLYHLLPRTVARKLVDEGTAIPEAFHCATIMFSNVVGFNELLSRSTPVQVVNLLNKFYMTIDGRLKNFDVYKVETIGDGCMIASGLPRLNEDKHVEEIANLAMDLMKTFETPIIPHLSGETLCLRIGFNTGPCVAGVVGIRMPRYCVFGDTVNTAAVMEATSLPLKIQMSESSAVKLQVNGGYIITERGNFEIKNKGTVRTFWLDGYKNISLEATQTSTTSCRLILVKESGSMNEIEHD